MTLWLLAALVGVGVIVWLLSPDRRQHPNGPLTLSMQRLVFSTLLYQGRDGGEVRICSRDGSREIVFRKYVRSDRGAGIYTNFSLRELSTASVQWMHGELIRRGITMEQSRGADGSETATIDLGQDISQAPFVVGFLVRELFGVLLDEQWVAYFNDQVLPTNQPKLTGVQRPHP